MKKRSRLALLAMLLLAVLAAIPVSVHAESVQVTFNAGDMNGVKGTVEECSSASVSPEGTDAKVYWASISVLSRESATPAAFKALENLKQFSEQYGNCKMNRAVLELGKSSRQDRWLILLAEYPFLMQHIEETESARNQNG